MKNRFDAIRFITGTFSHFPVSEGAKPWELMFAGDESSTLCLAGSEYPSDPSAPHWYAAFTSARHEKCVSRQMTERGIDCFLPLFASVHHWKDRNKRIELPLFPSYVFVRIALKDKLRVLQLPGVLQLVGKTNGVPTSIPDREINAIQVFLNEDSCLRPYPYLMVGQRARVHSGPMAGSEGILVRKKGGLVLVLSIQLLMRSVAVEVDAADVDPLPYGMESAPQQVGKHEAAMHASSSTA